MNGIVIFYFSGTGNTEYIAELIKDKFTNFNTDLFRIEDILNNIKQVDVSNYRTIGIGFPSYGFNAPKIVVDFIRQLDSVRGNKCFLFLTCAGPCYLNDVAFFGVKHMLNRKGYEIIYEKTFCMPANILLKYDLNIIKRIYDAAVNRVMIMTSDISNNIIKIRHDRFLPYLFRWLLILIERPSIKSVPLDFYIGKGCNQCMKCVRMCPRQNIYLRTNKIKHGLNCEACYRCVYICPQKAIKGRLYSLAIHKEGYNIKEKIGKCKTVEIKYPLKGIYKTLESYFNSQD